MRKGFFISLFLMLSMLLLLCSCNGFIGITGILFADPNLEQAVRNAEGYTGEVEGPIFLDDVQDITILDLSQDDAVESLIRNEYGSNHPDFFLKQSEPYRQKTTFYERDSSVGVISSLVGIEHLVNLQTLLLPNNNVSDLSPLKYLLHLKILDFSGNHVTSISCLKKLNCLE
ncbi:MAG TPA: hypothetical protein PKW59_14910, partial [Thermotogota bacterium]|nr:hypothetical protein [Thermotogota bacterium]